MNNPPEGLTPLLAKEIVRGQKSANPEHVRALLEAYAERPNNPKKEISTKTKAKLKSEFERTRLSGRIVFNRLNKKSEGLTKGEVIRIIEGREDEADPSSSRNLKLWLVAEEAPTRRPALINLCTVVLAWVEHPRFIPFATSPVAHPISAPRSVAIVVQTKTSHIKISTGDKITSQELLPIILVPMRKLLPLPL